MKKLVLILVAVLALTPVALYAISTITEVKLDDGRETENKIASPIFDGAQLTIGAMQSTFDRNAKIVRAGTSGLFTKGPEYNLDKKVDLAALLNEALKVEAASMGFKPSSGSDGWRLDGTLKDIYMESKQIPYGPTLFYGYMDVEFQVRNGGAAPQTRRMRFHNYFGAYNAGMGRKDEAQGSVANLLVEGAQEAVTRLNREFFKAKVRPEIADKLKQLQSSGVKGHDNDVHVIGLSGSPEAPKMLLDVLSREKDEGPRYAVIDALGRIGSAEVVAPLMTLYATEKEDPRFYILEALDYIGTPEAVAFIKEKGAKDKDLGPKRLAARLAAAAK